MKRIFILFALLIVFTSVSSAQLLLEENFDYGSTSNPDITTITPNWLRHGGTQGPVYSANGLTYGGYANPGIGGSLSFTNGGSGINDGDVNSKCSAPVDTTSTIYVSFLVRLDSAKTTGDYFLHLGPYSIGTTFRLRVFAKDTSSLGWLVGLSKSSEPATYSTTILSYNQTYLVVGKYSFDVTTTSDDLVTLYVYSSGVPSTEPGTPLITLGPLGAGVSSDPANIGAVAIRQGTNTPTGRVDGIRVATSWSYAPIPVELTSFTANLNGRRVDLSWTTATETNNYGFEVERASSATTPGQDDWMKIGFVKGAGTTSEKQYYAYSDDNSVLSGKIYYRLKQIDFDGSHEYSKVVEVDLSNPGKFELRQNFPNPFNPATKIYYSIPSDSYVKLQVYSLAGELIGELVNSYQTAGHYSLNFDASGLATGIYIYKLSAGAFSQARKMIVVK